MAKLKLDMMRHWFGGDSAGGTGGGAAGAPSAVGPTGGTSGGLPPLGPLAGGTAASGAPAAAGAPSGAAPAATTVAGGQPIGGLGTLEDDPTYVKGQDLIAKGKFMGSDYGGDALIAQGQALVDSAKENWQAKKDIATKTQEATATAQTTAQGKVLESYLDDKKKALTAYGQLNEGLDALSHSYSTYKGGRLNEAKAEIAGIISALGGPTLPQTAGYDVGTKQALLLAFNLVQASGLQRAPRAGLREAILTMPSPDKDPAALRRIITEMKATLEYNHKMYSSIKGGLNVDDQIDSYIGGHDFKDELAKARKETPKFQGITPQTLKVATGEDWPMEWGRPPGMPANFTKYSPSTGKYYDPQSGQAWDPAQ
jgi:hypothetical protein